MEQSQQPYWVGLDWSDAHHQVVIVDAQGTRTDGFRVKNTPEGYTELIARLRAMDGIGGVALETSRHVVVYALVEAGFTVYPVNPKLSAAWRNGWTVAGAKSDDRDAWVLAAGVCHHHTRLQPWVADDPSTAELKTRCETEMDLIAQRTAAVNQLQSLLKEYYMEALAWFVEWTSPAAWDFVAAFPTPQVLASAPAYKLQRFFTRHHMGLPAARQARIADRTRALSWPCPRDRAAALGVRAQYLVARLRLLETQVTHCGKHIAALFSTCPDAALFLSLPGVGPKLAPRLASAIGTDRERFRSAASLQQLSGVAPVTKQSGQHCLVHQRRACQKPFRNTMHQFAMCSLRRSVWARLFYRHLRAKRMSHARALRHLASKWMKIIYRTWQERTRYDELRYIDQLIRRGSPIADQLSLWKTRQENA